ncbi:MAG: DUF2079 domain-containing protein [Bacteroidales bacterium]|nr:DUF2079 domain-containing protein [Bacteroidales bacterium]MCF8456285.1 DUF2079 domain-containing protein [Bacteroidales bacterium]
MSKTFNKKFVLIVVVFGILYSLIAIVNHYNFRTYALDLGAYTNALYDYIHFQWNDSTVFKEVSENLLSDHFDMLLIIFSPLSLLFGTYTLLIVQLLFILWGGVGVYKFFSLSDKPGNIPFFAALYFYLFFGVFAAVAFDYHSNVIVAALVPWFFYLLKRRKIIATSLLLLVMLVSKENMPLWLAFICLGLAVEYRKDIWLRNYLAISFFFCMVFFMLIISVIMPAFANNDLYPHFHYSVLGSNFKEAIVHLILHPIDSIKVLFVNHTGHPDADYVKTELHVLLVLSGLPLLLKKPQYILMLLPIYFQKLFHDNYGMWGIAGQYNIEFTPILAIGIFRVIAEFKSNKWIRIISIGIVVLVLASTFRTMDNTTLFTDKARIRFYQAKHYVRNYDVGKVHTHLSEIPKDACVSAQSPFLPHLSLRDKVYQFPIVKDAEYVVFSRKESTYPLGQVDFDLLINKLEKSIDWNILFKDADLTILKRATDNK